MTSRRYGRLFFVVGSLTLSLILSVRFSFVQSEQPVSVPDPPNVLAQAKLAHPACPTCFTYACPDCSTIMEEIPGTGLTIARQIPNPAPLEPDEQRLEFDPETGLPIWYIGRQPYVGPTDEQPYSAQYPVPLIELKRIHARVQDKIFSIPGVHAFGIGGKGFVVYLEPEQSVNEVLVPQELEGVPVEVEVTDAFAPTSHDATTFRPVPSGVAIQGGQGLGTVGPHIVRTANGETRIHTLTANHVLKFVDGPVSSSPVYQPLSPQQWGTLVHGFQMVPCDTPTDPTCQSPSAPVNLSWQKPDVAAIQNVSPADPYPHTSPAGSAEPIRRLQYGGGNTYVNGPSGIIVSPAQGASAKLWGAFTSGGHAPVGSIGPLVTARLPYNSVGGGTRQFRIQYVCLVNYERNIELGDSGALVAGNGSGNRHVFGVHIARSPSQNNQGAFILAGDIQTAFTNSGFSFSHFWGTASGRSDLWWPAATQCDGSC